METVQDFKTRAMLTLPLQNLQLRGIRIEDDIFNRLLQAAYDLCPVRNGQCPEHHSSPVAGIDADELIDTRGLVRNSRT